MCCKGEVKCDHDTKCCCSCLDLFCYNCNDPLLIYYNTISFDLGSNKRLDYNGEDLKITSSSKLFDKLIEMQGEN